MAQHSYMFVTEGNESVILEGNVDVVDTINTSHNDYVQFGTCYRALTRHTRRWSRRNHVSADA